MNLSDEIKNASDRLAQTLHTAQATMQHLQSLLAMANQSLPDPPKALLVGDNNPAPCFEDHVHEVGSCICDTWPSAPRADVPPASDVRPVESHEFGAEQSGPPAVEHAPPPPSGKRARTEYSAEQWATGPHFLAYMKTEPFNTWTVAQQNATRDKFVMKYQDAPPQNRWGKTFSKFCGV